MNDDFNMSMRKFLKQVGVTSQKAIEDALRDANNGEYIVEAKLLLKILGWSIRFPAQLKMEIKKWLLPEKVLSRH